MWTKARIKNNNKDKIDETVDYKAISYSVKKLVEDNIPVVGIEINNPRQFYNSRLKKFLRGKVGSTGVAYRTYTLSSIGGLRIIDYRFEGSNFDDEVRAQAEQDK